MNHSHFHRVEKILGTHTYYEVHHYEKDKPALFFIHGFLSSSFSYRRLLPLFSNDYTLVTVDLPPFGKSEKSPNFTYSYANFGKIIHEIMRKLSLKNVTLIGHSMGGQVALRTLLQDSSLIQKAVLLNSSGYLYQVRKPVYFSTYLPFFHLYIQHWITKSGIEANLRNVVHDHSLIDEEMKQGYMEPFLDPKIFRVLTKMIRDREGDLRPQELNSIQTPILLLWGEHDRVVPLNIGQRLANDLPNSTLDYLPNTGHLLPEEKPEEVHEKIIQFLSQHSFNKTS